MSLNSTWLKLKLFYKKRSVEFFVGYDRLKTVFLLKNNSIFSCSFPPKNIFYLPKNLNFHISGFQQNVHKHLQFLLERKHQKTKLHPGTWEEREKARNRERKWERDRNKKKTQKSVSHTILFLRSQKQFLSITVLQWTFSLQVFTSIPLLSLFCDNHTRFCTFSNSLSKLVYSVLTSLKTFGFTTA